MAADGSCADDLTFRSHSAHRPPAVHRDLAHHGTHSTFTIAADYNSVLTGGVKRSYLAAWDSSGHGQRIEQTC